MGARITLIAALLLTGCQETKVQPNPADRESAVRGRVAAERLGCGACHVIPSVWPKGKTGPSLAGFSRRGMIAGKLPNRPDTLTAFLLDPSATAMPKVPMTAADAADLAAFLHRPDAS